MQPPLARDNITGYNNHGKLEFDIKLLYNISKQAKHEQGEWRHNIQAAPPPALILNPPHFALSERLESAVSRFDAVYGGGGIRFYSISSRSRHPFIFRSNLRDGACLFVIVTSEYRRWRGRMRRNRERSGSNARKLMRTKWRSAKRRSCVPTVAL